MIEIIKYEKQEDLQQISAEQFIEFLHKHLEEFGDPLEDIRKCLNYAFSTEKSEGGFALAAFDEGELAGTLIMNKTGMANYIPDWVLVFVAVDKSRRGKGIGKKIIEEAISYCDGDIKLHVEYDNPAKRLYEWIGFTSKYAEMRFKKINTKRAMASTSYIEIDRDALDSNIRFLKGLLGNTTRISAVLKGNAYGHGLSTILPGLEELGIDHFSVYSSAEARQAHEHASPGSIIMVMGYIDPGDLEWIIRRNVEFYISDPESLEAALEAARQLGVAAKIHLELETGMYRTGLTLPQLRLVIPVLLANTDLLHVSGVSSHFAGAESIANDKRVRKQFTIFNLRVKQLKEAGVVPRYRHIACSAAAINYPDTRLDLVRTGVLIYGYWPTRETFLKYFHRRKEKSDPLKRVMNWHTSVAQVKNVPLGDFIGYGISFQTIRKMRIMVVPVGYCNGYSRSLSNNGHVIVRGQRSPVIGQVNMNMIICDVTDIPDVKPGDKVILIGKQGEMEITVSSFADMNNSLNYEILARLPENIERKLT